MTRHYVALRVRQDFVAQALHTSVGSVVVTGAAGSESVVATPLTLLGSQAQPLLLLSHFCPPSFNKRIIALVFAGKIQKRIDVVLLLLLLHLAHVFLSGERMGILSRIGSRCLSQARWAEGSPSPPLPTRTDACSVWR